MSQIPHGPKEVWCPLWKREMAKVCHTCAFWKRISTTNKATGETEDHWECAISLLPALLIENGLQTRQAGAAVESARNEAKESADRAGDTTLLMTRALIGTLKKVEDAVVGAVHAVSPPQQLTALENKRDN